MKIWVAVLALVVAPVAESAVVVTGVESGGHVVMTASGSLNLTALSFASSTNVFGGIFGSAGQIVLGANPESPGPVDFYTGILTGPASFGTGAFETGTTGTGPRFGISGTALLLVPAGYTSGDALSGSLTFTGETFASLGVSTGTYTWTWGAGPTADSFTLELVPEPGTWLLVLSALAWLVVFRRHGITGFGYRR